MSYFPMCIDLEGATVLLVGCGPQIRDKEEKLLPFGPVVHHLSDLSPSDLLCRPALVIAGDLPKADKERISALCRQERIPVNVVDEPELCTFFFPSLIKRGDLTVSVSTGGKSPAAAAWLRRQMEAAIPDNTAEILLWLHGLRQELAGSCEPSVRGAILRQAAALAFRENRPLTEEEVRQISTE